MAHRCLYCGIFYCTCGLRANVFYTVPMNPLIADIQMPLWLALLVGGVLSALVAFLIGTPVFASTVVTIWRLLP